MSKSIRFLFFVQGEGRGHMTQAISLRDMLVASGHEVAAVLVGKSKRRQVPAFFFEKIQSPVIEFESPNFVTDKKGKTIKLGATIWQNMIRTGVFLKSMKKIDDAVKQYKPDVMVNFYDLLAGLYQATYKPGIPSVCIGHQYLLLHPDFQFPKKRFIEKLLVQLNTNVTAFGSSKKLGLSFRPMPDVMKNKIKVVPPLLRNEVFALNPHSEEFILAYMVNSGYSEEIIEWHKNNSQIALHCFWDKKDAGETYSPHDGLTFHQLNDKKFLDYMSRCKAYVSTAGFESICEAMYLGKPVMMVPTEGQFEQECNALDAVQSNAGISSKRFDFSTLLNYLPSHKDTAQSFRTWVGVGPNAIVTEMENIVYQ
jgi:uncharacterized protein (TIGR00661 family)